MYSLLLPSVGGKPKSCSLKQKHLMISVAIAKVHLINNG